MNKKINLTEKMAKNTNAGGVVVGKRRGQTMIFDDATAGGYFVGKLHSEGGIKAINKSTGQPIEVQGAEVIITAPAVADQTKREFDGKMMTNREILSTINERGGGVAFAESGMEIPTEMHFSGTNYNYGGKMLSDHDIAYELSQCGCDHEMKNGGHLAKGMSLKQIAKMHDVTLRHINRQVSYGMEAESEHTSSKAKQLQIVKDHLYENPNYYTILKTAGLMKGGGVKTSKVVTYKDKYNKKYNYPKNTSHTLEEISKDTNLSMKGLRQIYNKGIGAYKTNPESVRPNVKSKEQWAMARVYSAVMGGKASKVDSNELKMNLGGGVRKDSLVKDSKRGNTPARDLNNYNDVLDVGADGEVGDANGLAFAKGGDFSFLDDIDNVFYEGGTIGNEKVNSVKITSQSSAYNALNAKTFDSYKELKKAVREEFDNQNKRAGYFYFEVNGKPPRFGIQIKNGKNTVLNFNPNTGDADDFEKQLLRRGSFSYKKYDWGDWYSGNVSSSALSSFSTNLGQQNKNLFSPSEILEIDQLPDTNYAVVNDIITNLPPTIQKLVRLREFEIKGSITAGKVSGAFGWDRTIEGFDFWNKIQDGDFTEFKKMYGSGASGSTTSAKSAITTKTLSKDDLNDSKIWFGDNIALKDAIVEKLNALGLPLDSRYPINANSVSILIYSRDFTDGLKNKLDFDAQSSKEIFPADLGIDVNNLGGASTTQQLPTDLSQIPKSRMAVLFEIKKFVDDKNLTPNPAVVETLSNTIDFVDEETGDVFEFTWGNGLLNPSTKVASDLLFQFLDFQKGFDSFVGKKIKDISDGVADLDMLAVSDVRTFEKERKDIDALIKLLPSFQESKFAPQKATIIKEIGRLHKKITYEGFIFQNERYSDAKQLFTPQGLLKYYYNQTTQSPVAPLEPACELPTPNGAKSKLPLSTYFSVRTSRFKKWFGDWEKAYETNNYVDCSKMIDEETKEPKIFYHGVRKYVPNFGQFSNMGQGVVRPYGSFEPPTAFPASYFSDSEDYAKFYGGEAPNMPKPSADYEPFIYKVFLSAKNPISLLPLGFESSYKDMIDYLLVAYGVRVQPSRNVLNRIQNDMKAKHPVWVYVRNDIALLETLKDYGYDALIQTGDIPTFDDSGNVINDRSKFIQDEEYLTFYPTQVKSATVKKSFYFDFFKDIRFKQGGYVRI